MTKQELEAEANRLITGAKYALELQNEFNPAFLLHHPGQGWERLSVPKGSEYLMNIGAAKREIYGFVRRMVQEHGCDGVIFGSDTWQAKLTPEGLKQGKEFYRHVDSGYAKVVEMGWAVREEAITVTAQNLNDALIITQPYRRLSSGIQLLAGERHWIAQSAFSGRQKMFGDLREENLGEPETSHGRPDPV